MTEILSKLNYQLYPMSQLCVTKGNRNIRNGMLGTVTLVCTSGQGIRADVARFPLLAVYILFLCIKHNCKCTTLVAFGFTEFLEKMRGLMCHFVFPVASFVHITIWQLLSIRASFYRFFIFTVSSKMKFKKFREHKSILLLYGSQ
jgi:hypothetical protein